jgi:hypothetical protein
MSQWDIQIMLAVGTSDMEVFDGLSAFAPVEKAFLAHPPADSSFKATSTHSPTAAASGAGIHSP